MKLGLIYYKNVLDIAVKDFFDAYSASFKRDSSKGRYVFGGGLSMQALSRSLERCIVSAMSTIMDSSSVARDDYVIVIGSCYPKDNILLPLSSKSSIPTKLDAFISSNPTVKWLLNEDDIDIDIDALNGSAMSIFNKYFNDPSSLKDVHSSIMFISHSKLDCYMMFKVLKWAYGDVNCVNLWDRCKTSKDEHLVSLNSLIARFADGKKILSKNAMFKRCANEVKAYVDKTLLCK